MFEKASVVSGSTSDGYHTFDELYDHRCLLWIALILQPAIAPTSYWVREHFAGWDLLVHTDYSEQSQEQPYLHNQLSYHVPAKYRELYEGKITETGANNAYDGHTSKDVLQRLAAICRRTKP